MDFKILAELTAREKYDILLWADTFSTSIFLCNKIEHALSNYRVRVENVFDIQEAFNMNLVKPANLFQMFQPSPQSPDITELHTHPEDIQAGPWWRFNDPSREIAWKTLLEYWKNQADLI